MTNSGPARARADVPPALRIALWSVLLMLGFGSGVHAQSFGTSNLDFAGLATVSSGTSLTFGPDGRLYVLQLNGTIDVLRIERNGVDAYAVVAAEELSHVKDIPNHDDDGSPHGGTSREATGIAVTGTATNPVVYATSSDARIGGPSGDKNLDTNSGVITRIRWVGVDLDDPNGTWEAVDIVRGLPRSEENHATNGLDPVTIGGRDYLIVAQGGHANAGSPSTNFAWTTEYALSAAVLAVDLTALEALPIQNDGARDYVYDLPTVDDPTRPNINGVTDPNDPAYDGVDVGDPFGGNDGLNQAKVVVGGPVQIFSPGYRNTYDLVVTAAGAVYVTDNGANGGWGGFPEGEGPEGNVTNNYRPGEPGSNGADPVHGDPQVNNKDHLTLVTNDVQSYVFGTFYGGHPVPIRANPAAAGLFARGPHSSDLGDSNGNTYEDDWFRTVNFDPLGVGDAADPQRALPADWPPVPIALANPVEGDFRNPGGSNPDGIDDVLVTTWSNNTNGIDEYTASNFGGAMQGDLIAGKSGGSLHRVQLNPADGSLDTLTQNWVSNLGGNPLGVTANGDADPFPGTIWVATFNANIVVLEPQDFVVCVLPGEPGYDPQADNDSDGYTNQDEEDNGTDACNGGSQPDDFDKVAGAPLVSDLNDADDDADGLDDALDPFQIGDPAAAGSDAFSLPVLNELFSDNPVLGGYLGLGLTGLMNNGAPNPNWLAWLDQTDAGPNPNDILGGAVGAMTMQMTEGTAVGAINTQEKGFQYGVEVDLTTGGFRVESRMLNFTDGLQLYPFAGSGELGIFIGDGSQSDFVRFTVDRDGVKVLQETADLPQLALSAEIAVVDRPDTSLTFRLDVDCSSGAIEASYAIDDGAFTTLGALVASGAVLDAIQQPGTPLAVGLAGSSNTAGAEVEGTWDYVNVVGRQPSIEAQIPDISEPVGGQTVFDIDLDAYFDDDGGDDSLVYTAATDGDPTVSAGVLGSVLTVTLPAVVASAAITARATDADGLYAEQSFTAQTTNAVPIYRVNAGGPEVAGIDGGLPWSEDTSGANSPYLADPGSNNTAGFSMVGYDASVDLETTPTAIYLTERWDNGSGAPRVTYAFPVAPGSYEVRLYMGNGWDGASSPGQRVFSVEIEGEGYPDLTDLDLTATFGHQVGGAVVHVVEVLDGSLEVEFFHGAANNPMLNGIEIVSGAGSPPDVPIAIQSIAAQTSAEGEAVNLPVLVSGGDTGTFLFSAVGLPTGLQIEPTTGLVFGTVAAGASVGSPYAVSVSVDDNDADLGDVAVESFAWSVPDPDQVTWIDLAEDEGYTARHECSFVQAGDRFYLFGGRENAQTLDTYDYGANAWSTSAPAPLPFNHFQATEYQGLVWVVGAFETNSFPNEDPADHVWVFDPANDAWMRGPEIPVARRRGGAGLVQHGGKFYVVAGNTIGHNGGYVPWFDVFDPRTGVWTELPDAPGARDHFHAAVYDDALYVAGGRLSGGPGGTFAPLVAEVDVYDFGTQTWSTLPAASDLPTPRAAAAVAVFDDQILVIGGEGNGQAYDTVEALDPLTNTWQTLASLNHARHGTQAIVSGAGVYVAAGSPNQGGGSQKNMEVYDADAPTGTPATAGELSLSVEGDFAGGAPVSVLVSHTGGNQGVYVTGVTLTGADAADFALTWAVPDAFLVGVGEGVALQVEYLGATAPATATLELTSAGGATWSVQLDVAPSVPLESGTVAAGSDWAVVTLAGTYVSPVVVATPRYDAASPPVVTRVRNAGGDRFELRLDRTDGGVEPLAPTQVHYVVVEEGVYDVPDAELRLEAVRYTSTVTDNNASWVGEGRGYQQPYANPVVLGQVMSANSGWSVFWSRGPSRTTPATAAALFVGKHVGEDPDRVRADETVGYLVFEAGGGVLDGRPWVASAGAKTIEGVGNAPPYAYAVPGVPTLRAAVASAAAMNGGNGGWPVLYGAGPPSSTVLELAIDEDQLKDAERYHISEPVSWLAIGEPVGPQQPVGFAHGSVDGIASDAWTSVPLGRDFDSMVVVATPVRQAGDPPVVTRVREATASTFEIRVDRADGVAAPVSGVTAHWFAVEEGTFDAATYGVSLEAAKFVSSRVDAKGALTGEQRAYAQPYTAPVVVGQVMSDNDPRWSTFWTRGSTRTNPPDANNLWVGRHVGEDPDLTRADETLGYVVFEAGPFTLDGLPGFAQTTADTLRGVANAPPFDATAGINPTTAVATLAAMDGGDGGWAVLWGPSPVEGATLHLAVDEDTLGDGERAHTTEQAAVVSFGGP